jgi:Delta6-protoilludene synthase
VCTIEEYMRTRRENIGARPSFVLGELHLSIPDYAFRHPVIKELEYLIADLIILDNVSQFVTSVMGEPRLTRT